MKDLTSSIQKLIWYNIKDLPKESIDEILNFILYIRAKTFNPELFGKETNYEVLNNILKFKSIEETIHLEEEFEDYKTMFPHE